MGPSPRTIPTDTMTSRWNRSRLLAVGGALTLVVGCGSPASPSPGTETPTSHAAGSQPASTSQPPPGSSPAGTPFRLVEFPVTPGSHPHDVAPAADGGVWYTGQRNGTLGYLDPATGDVREIALGQGSAPHGVIVDRDGAPWVTDGGLNAIVRVDPVTEQADVHRLPADAADANLNTATFDGDGVLWFTGQAGIYGRFDPRGDGVDVFQAPGGRGPYGMTTTPGGEVWYASLAGSHIALIDRSSGAATTVVPPTAGQGARRVWAAPDGRLWVAEWNAGQVAVHDPGSGSWREWRLPGAAPQAYAVFVDDQGIVWLTDFGSNAIVRFDPGSETFAPLTVPTPDSAIRQLLGRRGEVWGAESGADKLVVVHTDGA